jgi:succinate-semialdehyde dehydrogenase/glutarate-semialdehyde dehydrogenase
MGEVHAVGTNTNGSHARRTIESREPATGAVIGTVPVASRDDVFATIARARKAQAVWSVLPLEERCTRLLRFRDAIVARAEELVEIIRRETGKPNADALTHEVITAVDYLTYYCKNAKRILTPRELSFHYLKHKKSVVHYVPRGVVGIISPWNFPFIIPMADLFTALVAGNAVVVKPSEVTPLVVQKAKEIFDSTGLPEDLFGVVYGDGAVGQALIEGGIQKLVFTGSVEVGKKVAAACGANLVPCVIELGGKAPVIACADCDVERTAHAIVFGGFANSGQACVSVERVYAHESIYRALSTRVRELTETLRQGDPSEELVDVGAVTFPRQLDIVEKHIEDAVAKGARVVTGGKRRPGRGQFFEPTVLIDCNHTMTVMREEIFGPIVPIQKVSSEDEAVRLANESHLGLNAYVFTKDKEKGKRLAQRIEAGTIVVNDVLVNYVAVEAPFGGLKQSGFGRVHGDDALKDMSETRQVFTSRLPEPKGDPTRFPYSETAYRWQLRLLRAIFGGPGLVSRLRELL